jgi:hypothetical protein
MKAISDFIEADCELAIKPNRASQLPIFIAVYDLTHGDPCRTGCAHFNGGQCPAFRILFPEIAKVRDVMRKQDGRDAKRLPPRNEGFVRPSKKPFRW